MSFYMDVTSMLDDYGVDIEVWKSDKPHTGKKELVGGFYLSDEQSTLPDEKTAEKRHEPVVPVNQLTSQMMQILTGGSQTNADLMWLSSGVYPVNTMVKVPTQGGYFRVTNFSNYQDYSNLTIYELKGDDEHRDASAT